jgi:hypothetical protein
MSKSTYLRKGEHTIVVPMTDPDRVSRIEGFRDQSIKEI